MIRHPAPIASPAPLHPFDDKYLLDEILLRLPPQPSSLPRATLVCTCWRNIILDPDFLKRFRRHHQKPPLLGFFAGNTNSSAVFVPTLDSPDSIPFMRFPLQRNRRYEALNVHGCHHGLAILLNLSDREAIVWDPLTGHDYQVPFPPRFHNFTNGFVKNAVVLCAATEDGHVHGDSSLSPFKVAFMSNDFDQKHAMCCLYESESGVWGNIFLVATTSRICDERPGIIVGNLIYWLLDDGGILELDLERQSLCVIEKPTNVHFTGYRYFQILWTKDDGLGLAILLKSNVRIQLWGRRLKNDGVRWVLQKTIQLDQLLSLVLPRDRKKTYILGYDNDSNTMVLSTAIGALMVQLDTMEFRNIPKRKHATYYPYRNFYTTGLQEASRIKKGEICPVKGCILHDPELYFCKY
ncbi:hypothetical protein VPH35_023301 [Triticum aestivum]